MNKVLVITLVVVSNISCKQNAKVEEIENSAYSIILDQHTKNSTLNDFLELESCAILDNRTPISHIERTIIYKEKIYILDSQSKITCFNMKGDFLFKIFKEGRGPGEYLKISDFSIDRDSGLIQVYCTRTRKLISYSTKDGKFKKEQEMRIAPISMASNNGYNYFYNPYRTVPDKDLQYTLLISESGVGITGREFAHTPELSSYRFNLGLNFPFYYNNNELLFKLRFAPVIYSLKKGKAVLKYEIKMNNYTPLSFWEKKPNRELRYSEHGVWGINNVYESNNVLYFLYKGEKRGGFVFYDIPNNRPLFYSNEKTYTSSKELPIFSLINGVYNNSFFCVIDAVGVLNFCKKNPETMPQELNGIKASDNPVIFFYKAKPNAY